MKALVTTDGSPLSESAFSAVEQVLGEHPKLELVLLKVLNPKSVHDSLDWEHGEITTSPVGPMTIRSPYPRVVESHGQALARLRDQELAELKGLAAKLGDRPVECQTVWSTEPADAIVQMARELGADVIVMATHGRSGLSKLVAGSISGDVMRSADVPVLLQRPRDTEAPA